MYHKPLVSKYYKGRVTYNSCVITYQARKVLKEKHTYVES